MSPYLNDDKKKSLITHLDYLRDLETKLPPCHDYIQAGSAILEEHRTRTIDWLQEVVDMYEMSVRSVFLAVSHTDRFLQSRQELPHNRYQLLGATCLHLASKCEDVSYIGIDDLANNANEESMFQPSDVLGMEEAVLNELNFHLSVPTSLDFLHVYMALLPPLKPVENFCKYLSELALLSFHLSCQLRPSVVAAAVCVYSLHCFDLPAWVSAVLISSHLFGHGNKLPHFTSCTYRSSFAMCLLTLSWMTAGGPGVVVRMQVRGAQECGACIA